MRDPLPNFELVAQLCAFMHSVPLLWNQDQLVALHSSGDSHVEYRGNEESSLSFDMQVVENELVAENGYLHIMVSVSDGVRPLPLSGSARQPLTTSFIWRASGEIDMPLPWEVYGRGFSDVG